jgi:peptidoglycan/LPS O-acetylase OafA/YrhL
MSDNRIIELDSLRGIAALAVVFYHYTSRFDAKFESTIITDRISFPYGHYGVELFFIISGFVIFMTVKNDMKPQTFLKKRAARLFPVFWLSMLFTTLMVTILDIDALKVNFQEFIINSSMIPSAFNVKSVDGVYWTLKIEWFFYFSILFLLILRWLDKITYISLFLTALLVVISIIYKVHPYFYYTLLFISGVNFYHIWKNQARILNHVMILSLILVSVISGKLELIIVSCLLVVTMYLLVNNKLKFLKIKPLLFFGKISYVLYLIHQNFGHSLQIRLIEQGYDNLIILILLPFSLSVFFSWLITYYFEIPVARKLRYFLS